MTEGPHTIRVTRGGTTVEVTGDREFVDERFDELSETYLDGEASANGGPGQTSPASTNRTKQPSLAELYTSADISYKRDAALLVGWYLEHVKAQDDFTKSEIEERALRAKVELGVNLSRDLSTLIEKGHLRQVDNRGGEKTYYLTRSGESYVTEEFGIEEHIG